MNIKNLPILILNLTPTLLIWYITTSVMAGEQQHFITNNSALLYTEIPIDGKGNYLKTEIPTGNEYSNENNPKNIVKLLEEDTTVVEMPKDNRGYYQHYKCKKSNPFGFQVNYDWILVRDWACVAVELTKSNGKHSVKKEPLVFYTQDFPPYSFKEGGIVSGPGAAIIREVCEDAGIDCEIQLAKDKWKNDSWKEAQNEVEQGNAEGLFFVGKNSTRDSYLMLSRPLVTGEYGFFVRADDDWQFNSIKNLEEKKVSAYYPSTTYNALKTLVDGAKKMGIGVEIVEDIANTEAVLTKLENKEIDIAYSNKLVAEYFIKRKQLGKKIKYAGKHKSFDYYIGIGKNSPKELTLFTNTLEQLKNEIVHQILVNYKDVKFSEQRQVGWVYRLLLKEKNQSNKAATAQDS